MLGSKGYQLNYHCQQDLMRIVIPQLNTDNQCIVMRVMETLGIFFREFDDRVVELQHLRHRTCQLDVMDHPQVGLTSLFR